jgi:hypothetical protein
LNQRRRDLDIYRSLYYRDIIWRRRMTNTYERSKEVVNASFYIYLRFEPLKLTTSALATSTTSSTPFAIGQTFIFFKRYEGMKYTVKHFLSFVAASSVWTIVSGG